MKYKCLKYLWTSILLMGLSCPVLFAQTDSTQVGLTNNIQITEQAIQQKVDDMLKLAYNGQPEAYAELFSVDGVLTRDEDRVESKDQIAMVLSRDKIPPTKYTVDFYPIIGMDSLYLNRYLITESAGFTLQYLEIWRRYDDDLKIDYANFVLIPNQTKESDLSLERLIISSIGLGVFLFVLLVIFKNARKWKK